MQATRESVMKRLLLLFLLCFGLALPWVAADGTSFNPTTISVKSVGASIPVGTVITWPSNSWPSDRDNWLECNGQSISSAVYPELVALIGIIRACSSGDTEDRQAITMARRTLEREARRAARGWNTRNMGRAFLSAPKPRWRSGAVRFTGLLERRAESMDE